MKRTFAQETFYTPEEVAQRLKLSLTTIYNLIKSHGIHALRIGKCYRIPETELSALWTKKAPVIPRTAINFIGLLRNAPFSHKIADVILFGSYARGAPTEKSDIDLMLIYSELTDKEKSGILRMETDAMEGAGFVDELSVLKKSLLQWAMLKNMDAGIYKSIAKEGVSIWGKKDLQNYTE